MNSLEGFKKRIEEINCLINLMPSKPDSTNVDSINALCRANIVLLCSHLEGYLQELMEEFVDEVNQLSMGFRNLPVELYCQQYFPKGQITQNNIESIRRIIEEVKVLYQSNLKISLEKKNFSNTESNPTADLINKLFKSIGVEDVLDVLNVQVRNLNTEEKNTSFLSELEKKELNTILKMPAIVNHIDNYLASKRNSLPKKRRDVGFYNTLNRLLIYRNSVAHGDIHIRISIQDLIELKDDITCLAENLYKKMRERVAVLNEFSTSQGEAAVAST